MRRCEDFDFHFAKPPVASAPLSLRFTVRLSPQEGQRPRAQVLASSSFSLPVERGWPRDHLSKEEVAEAMEEVLLDRLPRFAADFWSLEPLGPRGIRALWSPSWWAEWMD